MPLIAAIRNVAIGLGLAIAAGRDRALACPFVHPHLQENADADLVHETAPRRL
jgi:enoyl-CoA hydratase/carnithine racemase